MKLRNTLVLSSLAAGVLCSGLIGLLLFTVSEVESARQLQQDVRAVEVELDGVSTELLVMAPVRPLGSRCAELDRAIERVEQAIAVDDLIAQQLADEFDHFKKTSLKYTMAVGHALSAKDLVGADFAAVCEERAQGLHALRVKVDSLAVVAMADMRAAQDRVMFIATGLLGLLVMLFLGLTLRITRSVLRPTRDLKAAMEEMDRGHWPVEVEVGVNDELGELTATFNAMALGKRESEEKLQSMHEDLEDRVERRTSALEQANLALESEIEERKRAEGLLRASEERFRRIFEEGPIGIALVARDHRFLAVNQALAQILGLSAQELEGQEISTYHASDDYEPQLAEVHDAFRDGSPSHAVESAVMRPGGEVRRIRLVAAPVRGPEGDVEYGLLMVEDITDRKRAEELLLENERFIATGRMAARVAHEINNPLAGIKNAFRLVKRAVPGDHEFYRYVPRIDKEIDRVARIVRQMYELYRPPAENVVEFRVDEAIDDVVALMSAGERREGGSEIVLDVSRAAVKVSLVEGLLRQVLYNLIQNAIEHSAAGSPVRVTASVERERLEILVVDTGEGIPAENVGRIFEAFFTTKEGRQDSGLGLGLSITLRAVEAMGGKLTFESSVGVGTVFRVLLPLECGAVGV